MFAARNGLQPRQKRVANEAVFGLIYRPYRFPSVLESGTMRQLFFIVFVLVAMPSLAVEATFEAATEKVEILDAEMWARPRTGASVASMSPVRKAVRRLLAAPDTRLVIRFPGGEEGSLWAEELHVWLIALGIDAASMDMRPGSARADQIELLLENR